MPARCQDKSSNDCLHKMVSSLGLGYARIITANVLRTLALCQILCSMDYKKVTSNTHPRK